MLLANYHTQLDHYQTDTKAALALLSQGDSPRDQSIAAPEHAAYTMVASLILNLNQTVTKD